MASPQDPQPPLVIINGPESQLPPSAETGWKISVPPPTMCNVGDLPYPIVLEGPKPERGLSEDQKMWTLRTLVFRHTTHDEWKEVEAFYQEHPGLGPFVNRRLVVRDVKIVDPGLYIVHLQVSLEDKTQGKTIRRAVATSNRFNVLRNYDNTGIRRDSEHEREVQKLVERTPNLRPFFYDYQRPSVNPSAERTKD